MELLGRQYNIVATADGVEVNVEDCSQVSFVCVGADTYTVQEHLTAAGGGDDLVVIRHTYQTSSAAGAAVWTKVEQSVAAAVVTTAAVTVIEVSTKALSDGYKYLNCTATAAGLVIAICGDLVVQRTPVNLPALAV